MGTNFPGSLDTFPSAPTLATQTLGTSPHSTLHGNLGDALAAVEAKVGVNGSAVTSSLDYLVAQVTAMVLARLIAANNLSDLTSAPTARANLGLGSAATHASTDFDVAGAAAAAQAAAEAYSDAALMGYVPTTRTVNGHALSANVTVTKGDVGLGNVENTALSTWPGSANVTTLGTIATGSIPYSLLTGTPVTGVSSVFSRTGAVVATGGDYSVGQVTGAAPLASPTFTGTPAAPTATLGTNTTQLATTAFVLANATSASGANPTATVSGSAVNGSAATFMRSDAAPALANTAVTAGSYTHSSITVDAQGRLTAASSGTAPPSAANPTASVGLSAVNGSAATFLRSDGAPALDQSIAPTWTGVHTFTPGARSSGSAAYLTINAPADTGQTASTEAIGINIVGATRQHATGAITTQREVVIGAPTYSAVGSSTITTAVTLDIAGAPIAGTNATITTQVALRVQQGVAAATALLIKSAVSPTGTIFDLQDSGGTSKVYVSSTFVFNAAVSISSPYFSATIQARPGYTLSGAGTNYGLIQNDAAELWSLAYGTSPTALGTKVLQWGSATPNVTIFATQAANVGVEVRGTTSQSGVLLQLTGKSSTTAGRPQADIDTAWNVSTDASRSADLILRAWDTAAREGLRIRGSGTDAQLGFYGATPISRAVLATGAGHSVDDVITALQNLGLVKQS